MPNDPQIQEVAQKKAKELDAAALSRSTDLVQEDIEAIAEISSLECVRFIGGDFNSYEPLSRLPKLRTLAINHWSDEDLSSVGTIVQLRELDLCDNEEYADIKFISNLVNLEILNLSDGQFTDLSPVSRLQKLRILNLTNCDEVSDIGPLAALRSLEELHLNSTGITDLSPVTDLRNLRFLDIRGTDVNDLSPLAGLNLSDGLLLDDDKEYECRP